MLWTKIEEKKEKEEEEKTGWKKNRKKWEKMKWPCTIDFVNTVTMCLCCDLIKFMSCFLLIPDLASFT